MSISDRTRVLTAKNLIASAISNILQVVALRIKGCDGYDEDTDKVILAAEVALRHLHAAMSLIIDDGNRRGTITDHEALEKALTNAEAFRHIACVESGGSLELYPFIGGTQALIISARGLCIVGQIKVDVSTSAES